MRAILLLLPTTMVAAAAGCGSGAKEQSVGSLPQRDLTLVTQSPAVEIASPVELQQLRTTHHKSPRSSLLEHRVRLAAVWAPAPVLTAPAAVAHAAPTATAPANDRELLPGKTVTVIPVTSGPSNGTDKGADAFPAEPGHTVRAHGGGGRCRGGGRGPDIGMAPAPRPDFR